jgi:hypothetical protein
MSKEKTRRQPRIEQGQTRYRKAEENDLKAKGSLHGEAASCRKKKSKSELVERSPVRKGRRLGLHRDTKTGLSKVSEDHPGTLRVAKSAKKPYAIIISV